MSGALKGGGFVYARINTSGGGGKVADALPNTAAGVKVTSAHVKFSDNGLTPQNTIWGQGATFIDTSSGDSIYAFRHAADASQSLVAGTGSPFFGSTYDAFCLQCHVAHGSNASMSGDGKTTFSSLQAWPGTTTARGNESTLLKIDNRGTCVASTAGCRKPSAEVGAGSGEAGNGAR
jgi:hypothetical protein